MNTAVIVAQNSPDEAPTFLRLQVVDPVKIDAEHTASTNISDNPPLIMTTTFNTLMSSTLPVYRDTPPKKTSSKARLYV